MGSAEFKLVPLDCPSEAASLDDRAALKRAVTERLAAHRSRRGQAAAPVLFAASSAGVDVEARRGKTRSNRIAAAVADRYAQSQSYREFLAAEAERAIERAHAAAEIAARNAEAVKVAQQQLLADLDDWDMRADGDAGFELLTPTVKDTSVPDEAVAAPLRRQVEAAQSSEVQLGTARPEAAERSSALQTTAVGAGLTVRLYENVGLRAADLRAAKRKAAPVERDSEEGLALDDEIDFRRAPVFEEAAAPPVPLAANLIEFPRQLVAARRSRPRLAEGPLREETDAAAVPAQLRIFEVEASQISTTPAMAAVLPEWTSIRLDSVAAETTAEPASARTETNYLQPFETAPMSQRLMATVVDGCVLGATFLACVTGIALSVQELPALPVSAAAAVVMLFVLFVLYQVLFFTFSEATPGMRYARIGLCTFADENPTRAQMRRRTWAVLLAACPLGIGFLWALLDEDRLGWHDRISRMYQRGY